MIHCNIVVVVLNELNVFDKFCFVKILICCDVIFIVESFWIFTNVVKKILDAFETFFAIFVFRTTICDLNFVKLQKLSIMLLCWVKKLTCVSFWMSCFDWQINKMMNVRKKFEKTENENQKMKIWKYTIFEFTNEFLKNYIKSSTKFICNC